jgi:hypothetical protein
MAAATLAGGRPLIAAGLAWAARLLPAGTPDALVLAGEAGTPKARECPGRTTRQCPARTTPA